MRHMTISATAGTSRRDSILITTDTDGLKAMEAPPWYRLTGPIDGPGWHGPCHYTVSVYCVRRRLLSIRSSER